MHDRNMPSKTHSNQILRSQLLATMDLGRRYVTVKSTHRSVLAGSYKEKLFIPGESEKRPAFERLLLPEYISNYDLQYLIK